MSDIPGDVLRNFVFERMLNQDTRTKTVNLLGTIDSQPAIVLAEKTAFYTESQTLGSFTQPEHFPTVSLIQRNDIYHWFLASQVSRDLPRYADAKLTLIFPATESHIQKHSYQSFRIVTETAGIYREFILPHIEKKRSGGRLTWVYNILEKKAESDSIIAEDTDDQEGFVLLPDLKWDGTTLNSLYTMALVRRRDIASIRDLRKKDVPWLRKLQDGITNGICAKYTSFEADQIRLYVHYQPSYYHFHIHAVAITHDGGAGQAVGKAILFQSIISQLENMDGGPDSGFADVELTYILGEESELWQTVFAKLKHIDN